jgi:acetolactate synthase-1/2/3 large subunit
MIRKSERPLLWVGHGIRLSQSVETFRTLLDRLQIPSLASWQAADLIEETHPYYAGRAGTYGQRAGNFAVQNCDLLICLGTRLAIPQMGYVEKEFARAAKKVVVEIDPAEISKFKQPPDLVVQGDVGAFMKALLTQMPKANSWNFSNWTHRCIEWRRKYPPCLPAFKDTPKGEVNSYYFIDRLSEQLTAEDVICTDMGTSLTCTHATIRLKWGQRLVTSTGLGEMGFGLPGAIGACFGVNKRKTIFIGVEGSLQMNLQELQTVIHHQLPLKIFILNNNSYLTIKHTERALFGERLSGSSPETGVSFPNLEKISKAYGFTYFKIDDSLRVEDEIRSALSTQGPVFVEVVMPKDQFLGPKSGIKRKEDGSIYSPPLEDLFPFLPREELKANMIVPLLSEDRS